MEFAVGLLVDTDDDLDDTEVSCCCGRITTQGVVHFLAAVSFVVVLGSLGLLMYVCFVLATVILFVGYFLFAPFGGPTEIPSQNVTAQIENLQEYISNGNYSSNLWLNWLSDDAAFWTHILQSEIIVIGFVLLVALFVYITQINRISRFIESCCRGKHLNRLGIVRFSKKQVDQGYKENDATD